MDGRVEKCLCRKAVLQFDEMILCTPSLNALDLAVKRPERSQIWENQARDRRAQLPQEEGDRVFKKLGVKLEQQSERLKESEFEFLTFYTRRLQWSLRHMSLESKRIALLKYANLFNTLRDCFSKTSITQRHFLFRNLSIFTSILYQHFQDDSEVVVSTVQYLCVSDDLKVSVFHAPAFDFYLHHCMRRKFDFWGLLTHKGPLSQHFNPVWNSIINGRFEDTPKLLKYGFSIKFMKKAHEDLCDQIGSIEIDHVSLVSQQGFQTMQKMWTNRRLTMAIMLVLAYIKGDEGGELVEHLNSFSLFFESCPEPYLTPTEFYDTLKDFYMPSLKWHLEALSHRYRKDRLHDGNYEDSTPRSLYHLCKCFVRERLAANFALTTGVEELSLPRTVQADVSMSGN